MPRPPLHCSVVIPCHGGAALTRACVLSLLGQRGGHELEILLVDNAGDAATRALAQLDPRVLVLPQERNLGFGAGCNAGLRRARHPHLLILNNDTQAAPHLLSRLGAALRSDPRIAMAAPVSNHVKGEAMLPCGDRGRSAEGRLELERELASTAPRGAAGPRVQDVDTLAGLCLLLHRDTLARVGPFDERFGEGNFEDDDLCLRARRLGLRLVIARDAFLHHEGSATFRALGLDLAAELLRRRADFRAKWWHSPVGRAVLCAQEGDLAGAARESLLARRTDPEWPDADWHLGRLHCEAGRHGLAAAHLCAFLRQCPYHTGAVILLGLCWLELGQAQRAVRLWTWARGACHFAPAQAADLLVRLGLHSRGRGELAAALQHFAGAAALQPHDARLGNWHGVALLELGRPREAIAPLSRAARGGFPLAHTNLGICHVRTGAKAAALHHFATAARLLPDDVTAQENWRRARAVLRSGVRGGVPLGGPAGSI